MSDNSLNYAGSNPGVLRNLIKLAVEHVSSVEVFSEDKYQAVLAELRLRSKRAATAIIDDYESLPYSDYLARWCRIQLLADIAEPASLVFLDRFLSRSMPIAPAISVRAQETIIGTTAIEAIARMCAAGHSEALRILERQRKNPSLFVRRAALRGSRRLAGATGGNTVPLHPLKTEAPRA